MAKNFAVSLTNKTHLLRFINVSIVFFIINMQYSIFIIHYVVCTSRILEQKVPSCESGIQGV